MKYILKFNESKVLYSKLDEDEYKYRKNKAFGGYDAFSKRDIGLIYELIKELRNKKLNINISQSTDIQNNITSMSIFIRVNKGFIAANKRLKEELSIHNISKDLDEYFYASIHGSKYKCDEIDGLIELIRDFASKLDVPI